MLPDPAGDLRGNFRIHVMHPDGTGDATLLAQDTTISDLSWSPDGGSIAYGSRNGTTGMIGIVDVASKRTRWLPFTANGSSPVWTAQGLYFLAADNSIHAASPDGSNARKIPHSEQSNAGESRGPTGKSPTSPMISAAISSS